VKWLNQLEQAKPKNINKHPTFSIIPAEGALTRLARGGEGGRIVVFSMICPGPLRLGAGTVAKAPFKRIENKRNFILTLRDE
jgi:hypothetical protein